MIQVIGLGGQASVEKYADLLTGARIVARASTPATAWLAGQFELTGHFDDLFEDLPPARIRPELVERLLNLSAAGHDFVYLVPDAASVGDSTVAALGAAIGGELNVVPGNLPIENPISRLQVVDALDLAIAEEQWPFDAGLAPLDPATSVLVTNLRGKSVEELALRRIGRLYGIDGLQTDGGNLYVEAVDPLAGTASMSALEHIVARLRRPDGCPWDQEQTPASLIPMTLEEVDELREAIDAGDSENQAEEIGDILLHLILMAQMAREAGEFEFGDVVRVVAEKMIRRHPHVFAGLEVSSMDDIMDNWQAIKAAEKSGADPGMLEGRDR